MSDPSTTPSAHPATPDSQINHTDSINYWNSISADVNGMLGGYPQVSRIDLQGSKNFISKTRRSLQSKSSTSSHNSSTVTTTKPSPRLPKLKLAVDCGAGIGRVTQGLLIDVSETVDIVEPIDKFASVLATGSLKASGKLGDVYVQGLEAWTPAKKYDLIWNQWCVGHLTDTQLTEYLRRAGQALTEEGWVCVKENLSTQKFGDDIFDEVDSSVTRSDAKFKRIFEDAGLDVIRSELQTGFPKGLGLFPVKMYALRPR